MRQLVAGLTVLVIALGTVTAAVAARPEIPIAGQPAFCGGEPVQPVNGVLNLDSSCVLNLQIVWIEGMDHADAEVSTDGGASWQKIPASVEFAVTPVGLTSGAAFGACNAGLSSGSYVFRAHGFRRPNDRGDLFSEPFPYGANLNC